MFNKCEHPESSDEDMMEYEDEEMQPLNYICLMCDNKFTDLKVMFKHIDGYHNFDTNLVFNESIVKDEYDWIKIINYFRANVKSLKLELIKNGDWKSDIYFQPVLINDSLLFADYNEIFGQSEEKVDELIDIKQKVSSQEHIILTLRQQILVLLENNSNDNKKSEMIQNKTNGCMTSEDKEYFDGYSNHSIHDIMIKDKVRTESYLKFIEKNGSMFFKDKIVLDVGCGTGILSIFAARAGASHVYGVDCADIIYNAMDTVKENGLEDKITLIHGKLEETSLPCDKVDVVISEWMGYFLIYESMLDSVLYACRKYLSPETGLVFPRYFTLSVVGADMGQYRRDTIDCWDNVYGIRMPSMKTNVVKEAIVEVVPVEDVITSSCMVRDYDVQAMAFDSECACPQVVESTFEVRVCRDGSLGAIVAYFDAYFTRPEHGGPTVMFSTGPNATTTHWQQVVLMLTHPMPVTEGLIVTGRLVINRSRHGRRGLHITLTIDGGATQTFEFA